MKVALLSDTHGYLPRITGVNTPRHIGDSYVDAVLHAGDIGVDRDPINWFRDKFYPWAKDIGVPIYATFGNHDRIGERLTLPTGRPDNLHFVVDELVPIFDVMTWFSPWSLRYGDWAFMANDATLKMKYARIPTNATQVIVSHGPPFGCGDLARRTMMDEEWDRTSGERTGSVSLLDRIHQLPNLKLVVTGHIHESRGEHKLFRDDGDHSEIRTPVRVINASHVNEFYEPVHPVIIIDWPPTTAE